MRMRLNKLEREIGEKEKNVSEIQTEMTKEEVYSDYIKLTEFQERLAILNTELENLMTEWGELVESLED